jgi:hypothetical protein
LPAAEVARAEISHLRAELVFVAAPLPAAGLVAGLAELTALITATPAVAVVVPVPVVTARCFGVFLAQADCAQ